jgi:2,3-bisphosphoglycerate-dependent phosphoglycerate mutase
LVEFSEWNDGNLFCGWYDADLSEKGVEEAKQAAKVCPFSKYKSKKSINYI